MAREGIVLLRGVVPVEQRRRTTVVVVLEEEAEAVEAVVEKEPGEKEPEGFWGVSSYKGLVKPEGRLNRDFVASICWSPLCEDNWR